MLTESVEVEQGGIRVNQKKRCTEWGMREKESGETEKEREY